MVNVIINLAEDVFAIDQLKLVSNILKRDNHLIKDIYFEDKQ